MIAHRDFEPGKRPSFLPKLPEIKAAFEAGQPLPPGVTLSNGGASLTVRRK